MLSLFGIVNILGRIVNQMSDERGDDPYEEGYEAGKEKAVEIIKEIEVILWSEIDDNYKDGFWDAIVDMLKYA